MMRRRTWCLPKPETKKCNVPQQKTKSFKKPAQNEEKVQLDLLVVEKIVSLTKVNFAPRFCQELVSKTFANALRSFYSSEKLKLLIATPDPKESYTDNPHLTLLCLSGFSKRWEVDINIAKENWNQAIEQILARFPQIHLRLDGGEIEDVGSVVRNALNKAPDVTIESLYIDADYATIIRCHKLIEKLSENLQALELRFEWKTNSVDESMSEKFWQTVASCPKLAKLTVSVVYGRRYSSYPLLRLADGLKLVKIKHFRINLRGQKGEMESFLGALAKNENLRELELVCDAVGYCPENFYTRDSEKVSLVLSRLDSLRVKTGLSGVGNDWGLPLGKILRALSDRAVLKVSIGFIYDAIHEEDIAGMLQFYLNLSHQTAKAIKLRLELFYEAVDDDFLMMMGEDDDDYRYVAADAFDVALDQLSSMKKFSGLQMIRLGNSTRILFGKANLMVETRTVPLQSPF